MRMLYALAVATLLLPDVTAMAQSSPPPGTSSAPPAMTAQQCANALAGLEQEALTCETKFWTAWNQLIDMQFNSDAEYYCTMELETYPDVRSGVIGQGSIKYFEYLHACEALYKQTQPRPVFPSEDVSTVWLIGHTLPSSSCYSDFKDKEQGLKASCGKNPAYGGLYCQGMRALSAATAGFGEKMYAPPDWCNPRLKQTVNFPPPTKPPGVASAKLAPPTGPSGGASVNLDALGCGSVPGATKACLDGCAASSKTPEQLKWCTDGCRANEKLQIDLCVGQLTADSQKDGSSRKSRSPTKLREPATSTTSTSAGVQPAKKNNLDRFGLGATFVDTTTSQAGTRTTARGAAAAVKGTAGSGSKMKATIQQDVVSQPSGGGTTSQSVPSGGIGASVAPPKYNIK